MSGWAFDSEETLVPQRAARDDARGSKPVRRAFFGEGSDDERAAAGGAELKRDSVTLVSTSRRSQRSNRAELVVDDSDDSSPQEGDEDTRTIKPFNNKLVAGATHDSLDAPARLAIAVNSSTARNGKSDELATVDLVVRRTSTTSTSPSTSRYIETAAAQGISCHYVHWLVRDFLEKRYPPNVLAMFDKEQPAPAGNADTEQLVQALHSRITVGFDAANQSTLLEQTLVSWDAQTHHKQLVRTRSRRKESLTASGPSPSSSSEGTPAEKPLSKPKTKSSSGSRKKPQLSVTIASEVAPSPLGNDEATMASDDGDFNRLNHPGHTPKAQDALLAAVIGKPGSTPKASTSELKALGFEDIDDESSATGPLIPTPSKPDARDSCDDDADGLSKYARRKRAARRHDKHVYIGEPGATPTKEYVFFRETPPRFVTETVEDAEEALRSTGGNPDLRRQQQLAARMERFVELQSSDVAKYAVGQRVENLGAQRNVSGLVSKLYGSRQCGTAGPGTVVIDTWNGSDAAPPVEDELLPVSSRPSTPGSSR